MCSSNTHSSFLDDKINVCETNKKEAKSLCSSLDKMNVSEANIEKGRGNHLNPFEKTNVSEAS